MIIVIILWSLWCHGGVTVVLLWSLRCHCGHCDCHCGCRFGPTMVVLWPLCATRMQLWLPWCHCGCLCGGATVVPLWCHCGATTVPLCFHCGCHCGCYCGTLWCQLVTVLVTVVPLRLLSISSILGHFFDFRFFFRLRFLKNLSTYGDFLRQKGSKFL